MIVDSNGQKFFTPPYVQVGFQDGFLYVGFGSINHKVANQVEQRLFLELLKFMIVPTSVADAKKHLQRFTYDHQLAHEVILRSLTNNFVVRDDFYDHSSPHSRDQLYYKMCGADSAVVLRNLKKKHVVVVGCGGIGNLVSVSLATAGVGRLTLIDDDVIEPSNLTRQILFTLNDIGKKKVEVLKNCLRDRVQNIQVDTIPSKLDDSILSQLDNPDLIVLSADSFDCLPQVNLYCVSQKIAYINVGYVQDVAVWGPFYIPNRTGCFYCQDNVASPVHSDVEISNLVKQINSRYQAPSVGSINMIASGLSLSDIIKFLGEFSEINTLNRRIGLWTHNMEIQMQTANKSQNCQICSD